MPVQRLITALQKLADIHEELIDLAERKRVALIANAVEEVTSVLNKETKLMRSVDELLLEQTQATNDFFRLRGFQPTRAITVTELARMVTDPEEKATLLKSRDRLAEVIARLKPKNELNQQLLQESLAFINYSLDLIAGPTDEDLMYQRPTQHKSYSSPRQGLFDRKA